MVYKLTAEIAADPNDLPALLAGKAVTWRVLEVLERDAQGHRTRCVIQFFITDSVNVKYCLDGTNEVTGASLFGNVNKRNQFWNSVKAVPGFVQELVSHAADDGLSPWRNG